MTAFSFRLVTSSNAEARTKMSDVGKASSQRDLDALHYIPTEVFLLKPNLLLFVPLVQRLLLPSLVFTLRLNV